MRVLIFTENDHAGGMDTFIAHCINRWPTDDEFVLACNSDHPGLPTLAARVGKRCTLATYSLLTREGITRRIVGLPSIVRQTLRVLLSASQYLFFIYHVIAIRRFIASQRPDRVMVVAGNYPGGSTPRAAALSGLFRSSGKPLFVYHNDPSPVRWFLYVSELLIDWLVERSVAALVTVSRATEDGLVVRRALRATRKRCVIPNGIMFSERNSSGGPSDRVAIRKELAIPLNAPVLLMLGTYEPRKGHAMLMTAFQEMLATAPNAILVCAGSSYPDEFTRVEQLVRDVNLLHAVRLLGFRNDTPALLSAADVLVVPSQQHESFGLTIVEAMAQRIPVVATCVGGIPEVLQDGEGGYVVPNDADAFACATLRLLGDADLRRRMGELGYQAARRRFDAARMARAYHDLVNAG